MCIRDRYCIKKKSQYCSRFVSYNVLHTAPAVSYTHLGDSLGEKEEVRKTIRYNAFSFLKYLLKLILVTLSTLQNYGLVTVTNDATRHTN